jgi:hypothetical protein
VRREGQRLAGRTATIACKARGELGARVDEARLAGLGLREQTAA